MSLFNGIQLLDIFTLYLSLSDNFNVVIPFLFQKKKMPNFY